MNFIIAQILGLIGALLKIVSIQFKSKKKILLMFILVNLITGIELILLKGYTGALICFIAAIQTFINYIYVIKNKKLPKFFIPIYVIISLIIGMYSYKELMDILPVICSMLYIASICQTKEKNLRILSFINISIWVVYNIYHMAYTDVLFKICILISNAIAIYNYDIKGKRKGVSINE